MKFLTSKYGVGSLLFLGTTSYVLMWISTFREYRFLSFAGGCATALLVAAAIANLVICIVGWSGSSIPKRGLAAVGLLSALLVVGIVPAHHYSLKTWDSRFLLRLPDFQRAVSELQAEHTDATPRRYSVGKRYIHLADEVVVVRDSRGGSCVYFYDAKNPFSERKYGYVFDPSDACPEGVRITKFWFRV